MKNFRKKLLLLLLTIPFVFSIESYAHKATPVEETEMSIPVIYGIDATVRNCNRLNIREKPSLSANVICTIDSGEHITVVDHTGKWFEIMYGDISGFVFWKYVSFTEKEITKDSNLIGNSIIHYTSSFNRDNNIAIACNTINGIILKPGDEFRWSNVVGQTTIEKGYLEANVIMNKKFVPGLGGGVCQVSTTIYNALLDTSIVPTELHKHSIGSEYAKKDATVAYGSKDFAFINTYDFPIKLETYSYKGVVFANIYKVEQE